MAAKTYKQWVDYHLAQLKKDKKYKFAGDAALKTLAGDMAQKSYDAQQSGSAPLTPTTPSPLPTVLSTRVGPQGVVPTTPATPSGGTYNQQREDRIRALGITGYTSSSTPATPNATQLLATFDNQQLAQIKKLLGEMNYSVPNDAGALKRLILENFVELFPSKDYNDFYIKLKARQITGAEGDKDRRTPAAALIAELDESFKDYLDITVDNKTAKEYANKIRALETARGGDISELERKDVLLEFIQNKAKDMFKQSVASGDSRLLEQGALGQTFRQIRNSYDKYGIPISDKELSKLAMNGVRSNQALQNVLGKIQLQAEAAFPSLKEYLKQGLTTRDALATHIGMYSQVYGIPENQVKISNMYDAFAADKLLSPSEWKRVLYSKPEFKNTETYQDLLMSDARALQRNFIG